jgi:hypothetical protein
MGSKGCGENRKSLIALVRVHFRCGVNVDGADRQPSALGGQRAVAPSHGGSERRRGGAKIGRSEPGREASANISEFKRVPFAKRKVQGQS